MMGGLILAGMPRANFDPTRYALTVDGNSICDVAFGSKTVPQLQALAPVSNRLTLGNVSHAGWSVQQKIASPGEADAAYVEGKINFLLLWEITNNVFNDGRTGLQTCDDLRAYIAARKAIHPWRVILMTGLPRGDILGNTWNAVTGEQQMSAANDYIRQNYRDMGAIALVEARRPGGPFDFTDATNGANFPSSLWRDRTHPNDAGTAILAGYMADELKRLPAH